MLVMQGLLPVESAKEDVLSQNHYIIPVINSITFLNDSLSDVDRLRRIKTYYKFVMVRNPLERLLSAYRNKIEPLLVTNTSTVDLVNNIHYTEGVAFFENHKQYIFSQYRPLDMLRWKSSKGVNRLKLSFPDFVQWILDTKEPLLNEHFASQITNSQPCLVKYHFYANFKNYSREVQLLIKKFNTSREFFTDHDTHSPSEHTRLFLVKYYSELSEELKYRLFQRMHVELEFYYHLYPEEQWSHAEILGIYEPVLTML